MALPRANRMSLRFERERISKSGKTSFGKYFTLVVADTSMAESPIPRFAILLSKKTAKKAVGRNKIKRITSALIESNLHSFLPKDYLLIPKSQVSTQLYINLEEDFKALIAK